MAPLLLQQCCCCSRAAAACVLLEQQSSSSICMHVMLQKEFECQADGSKETQGGPWSGSQQQQISSSSSSSSSSSGMDDGSSTSNTSTSSSSSSSSSRSSAALNKFKEDLKNVLLSAGLSEGQETLFLINESQILDEEILELADAVANTGEVAFRV